MTENCFQDNTLVSTIIQSMDNKRQVFLLHDSSTRFPGVADQPTALRDRKLFDRIALPFVAGYEEAVWDRIVTFLKKDPNVEVRKKIIEKLKIKIGGHFNYCIFKSYTKNWPRNCDCFVFGT